MLAEWDTAGFRWDTTRWAGDGFSLAACSSSRPFALHDRRRKSAVSQLVEEDEGRIYIHGLPLLSPVVYECVCCLSGSLGSARPDVKINRMCR